VGDRVAVPTIVAVLGCIALVVVLSTRADLLVQVTAATTTTPVLIVPATAIATRADGTTFVQVLTGGTDHRDVAVVTGAAADGQVQVTASTPGELRTGDEVLVGSS